MIHLGYDFYEYGSIQKPNGLISQTINQKNRDTSTIFHLYLPPYITEMFSRFGIKHKVDSPKNLEKQDLKSKWIYVLDCVGDPRGWLGKYNDGENSIKSVFSGISETTLNQVRDDKAVILIYQPMEGYPTDWLGNDIYEIIHDEIVEFKLNPKNVLYVTANWLLEQNYKKWKPKSKYKDSESIGVHSFNCERYLDFGVKWQFAKPNPKLKRDKHFLCYNRSPRGHRLSLLSMLHGRGLIEKGYVSCQTLDKYASRHVESYLHNIGVGKNLRNQNIDHMKEFQKGVPYIVDVDEWVTNHFDTSPIWPYEKSFFSVTTNTMFDEYSIFLDEKIWKPIYNHHPFIFVGCSVDGKSSLEELKSQGFKTFHPFIDESYDREMHPGKRLIMISKEIERLCSYTLTEMENWYEQLIPRLEHNHKNLFDRTSFNNFNEFLSTRISNEI